MKKTGESFVVFSILGMLQFRVKLYLLKIN